jgi:protein SCO1
VRSKAAALEAEKRHAFGKEWAQLQPYKVDQETGQLSPAENSASENQDPDRPPDIGDFELIERSGRKITNKDLLGQPWAVCFIFTTCSGQCLQTSANMAKLQQELSGAPVRLVSISVRPDYDTPEVLRNYANGFGADPEHWLFLTGEKDYVYNLLRGYFRQLVQEMTGKDLQKGYEVLHSDDVLHIDAQGRIVKRYHSLDEGDMIQLRRALLAEAEVLAKNSSLTASEKPALAEKPHRGSEGE